MAMTISLCFSLSVSFFRQGFSVVLAPVLVLAL